jgi:uroporphyrinogen III methyltransferase/synthase
LLKVDLTPAEYRGEAVISAMRELGDVEGTRVLLPHADIGREVIADQLREAGAVVTEVIAYRTMADDTPREGEPDVYGMLLEGRIDVVTFTSPSAIRNFVKVFGADQAVDLLKQTTVATIGPVTTEAATQLGIAVAVQPAVYTIPAMVDAIADHLAART